MANLFVNLPLPVLNGAGASRVDGGHGQPQLRGGDHDADCERCIRAVEKSHACHIEVLLTDNLFETNSGGEAIVFHQRDAPSPVEIVIDGNIIVHGTETIAFTIDGNQKFIVTNNLIILESAAFSPIR